MAADAGKSGRAPEASPRLVAEIKAGSAAAWQELIDRYEGRLSAFVRARLPDSHAVEDVVQETLLGFLRSLPHFDPARSLENYLFTIASHKIRDHLRKQGRNPMALLADRDGSDGSESSSGRSDEIPGRVRGPSSLLASAERVRGEEERLAGLLASLIAEWRAAGDFRRIKCVELLLVCGWANRDVAGQLGLSEQQVANYKFQLIERLARRIRRAEEADDGR